MEGRVIYIFRPQNAILTRGIEFHLTAAFFAAVQGREVSER